MADDPIPSVPSTASDAPAAAPDDLQFESRFRRLPPGAGELPLADFAHSLAAIGYRGVVSVEVLSTELRRLPPAEGARLLREALLGSWSEYSS